MFVSTVSSNNFNFKVRNNAQNLPSQIKMKETLNVDTVSFGSAKPDAMQNCIKMTKKIFTELNLLDRLPVEKQTESFLEAAKVALIKVKENLTFMKDANLPTREAKVANFKNNEIHAYKLPFVDGYIFEEYTKAVGGKLYGDLLNSIEVAPEQNYAEILHNISGEKLRVRGALSDK